jgi:hypothetical protein
MHCEASGSENTEDSKYCGECKTKLEILCQSCGTGNPPNNKFCFEYGSHLKEILKPH